MKQNMVSTRACIILGVIIVAYFSNVVETKPFISRFSKMKAPKSFHNVKPINNNKSSALRTLLFKDKKNSKLNIPKGYIGPPTGVPPTSASKPSLSNPLLQLTVRIPPASVNYEKELDVKAGGEFTLITPMENFHYSSTGNVNLRCALIQYQMQSSYSPSLMCFYLHFLTLKHDNNKKGEQSELCYMVVNDNKSQKS